MNVILVVLHDVFGSSVLLYRFPECFWYRWSWPPDLLDMNSCDYFAWVYLKDCVYYTNPHSMQELQAKIKADTEEITDDMLCNTVDNFVVH
jgi:hypothetical protein